MLKAVRLAGQARSTFVKDNPDKIIKIALSLGPFGASLKPAQDFDGYYPPPYGPMEFSEGTKNCNGFGEDAKGERDAIEALAQFHLERLLVFARDPAAWETIDCIAFETVPLVREVKAIREAMLQLQKNFAVNDVKFENKPWWITFVFPDGQCSEMQYAGGPRMAASDMIFAALQWSSTPVADGGEAVDGLPIPTGIGVNCTSLDFFAALVAEISEAVSSVNGGKKPKPWLVLYPNGGDVYDPISRTWQIRGETEKHSWSAGFGGIIDEITHSSREPGVWAGVVAGGCCRTRPEEIAALNKWLNQRALP
jgi:homocysteine S-methyltransferase